MKLWSGIEKEGFWKGVKTIFVGSVDVTIDQLQSAIEKYHPQQIYFGAGGCQPFSCTLIRQVLKYRNIKKPFFITIETKDVSKIPKDIKEKCYTILNIPTKQVSMLDSLDQIKLEGDFLLMATTQMMNKTTLEDLKGPKYIHDEVILE